MATKMRNDVKLGESIFFGDQGGIGVVNNMVDIGDGEFLQYRMRCCNHDQSPHLNTDLIAYGNNGRTHGKNIDGLVGYDVIGHRIDL